MITVASDGSLFLLGTQGRGAAVRVHIACFGKKRHYHKDGSCPHVEAKLREMKPWWRSRTTVLPFGDNDSEYELVSRKRALR